MKEQLTTARDILLTVRINAVADRWHLTERAVPALTHAAGRTADPRLHRALEHMAKAGELLHATRDVLVEASAEVEKLVPWPAVTPDVTPAEQLPTSA